MRWVLLPLLLILAAPCVASTTPRTLTQSYRDPFFDAHTAGYDWLFVQPQAGESQVSFTLVDQTGLPVSAWYFMYEPIPGTPYIRKNSEGGICSSATYTIPPNTIGIDIRPDFAHPYGIPPSIPYGIPGAGYNSINFATRCPTTPHSVATTGVLTSSLH